MAIPVNLITGFLGVGKTTAVIDLLTRKPAGSRWAVLVNEYGDVSIDGALIEGSGPEGVTVREVGGGCVCCASAPYLPVALHLLLLEAKPERLVIETTGLGHPARLLDTLRMNYADRLEVRATLGLVDPADFAKPEMRHNPIFVDQIQLSDVLVMNKLDTATPELIAEFQDWANGLFPPKLLIAGTTHGRLDPAWLDLSANDERLPLYPEAHAHEHGHDEAGRTVNMRAEVVLNPSPPLRGRGQAALRGAGEGLSWRTQSVSDGVKSEDPSPGDEASPPSPRQSPGRGVESHPVADAPGSPRRYPSPPGVRPACCGWVFDPVAVFDESKVLALLGRTPGITRLKGVFHLADEWATVNRVGTAVSVAPTAYRRDSRVEAFSDVVDWSAFEAELIACLGERPV